MDSRMVVLSPHLDDAVLSCWHLLDADVTVVTVFAGVPQPQTCGWWDRLTGASDSATRVRERQLEDSEALALTGAGSVRLDLLDLQYRPPGEVPAVEEAVAPHVREADVVYAPLGIILNTDHALVRDAALALGGDVRLYADHPHAGIWGLPDWVTGNGRAGSLDVGAAWKQCMSDAGLDPDLLDSSVETLDDAAFERKLAAVRLYKTQVEALEREAPLEQLRWEVTWTR
jgi:LmbE family N-acetylglucosaminyl deacetylase